MDAEPSFGERKPAPNPQIAATRTVIAPAGWVAIGVGTLLGLVVALVLRVRRREA